MSVRVVTDSASDIDGELARELGIAVVPQNVHFGTRTFEDNVTITPDELYGMLATTSELPRTSQASPGRFKEVYDELGREADWDRVHSHLLQNQRHLQLGPAGSPGRVGGLPGGGD